MGIEIDSKYGGADSSFFSAIIAIEELSKVCASVSVACDVQNTLINGYFRAYANKDLQDRYFPRLAKDLVSSLYCIYIYVVIGIWYPLH